MPGRDYGEITGIPEFAGISESEWYSAPIRYIYISRITPGRNTL
jgi:hypothetical protein